MLIIKKLEGNFYFETLKDGILYHGIYDTSRDNVLWSQFISRDRIKNDCTTTEAGYVADARVVKKLNDTLSFIQNQKQNKLTLIGLKENDDLNNFITAGYTYRGTSNTYKTLLNTPTLPEQIQKLFASWGGYIQLDVVPFYESDIWLLQRLTICSRNDMCQYIRCYIGGSWGFSEWKQIIRDSDLSPATQIEDNHVVLLGSSTSGDYTYSTNILRFKKYIDGSVKLFLKIMIQSVNETGNGSIRIHLPIDISFSNHKYVNATYHSATGGLAQCLGKPTWIGLSNGTELGISNTDISVVGSGDELQISVEILPF